jgi:pimeloyl-[acyl-carrier protein] methyl ester esterase
MINYQIFDKNKSSKNLVLIHGFGFCGEIFTTLIQRYQSDYKITTVDLPGHGKSQNIIELDNWVKAIAKIIPQNSIILGWSLGGLVAIKLAKITNAKKIILCASSPKFVKSDDWDYGIEKSNFNSFASNINLNITKGLTRFVSLQEVAKPQLKELKTIITNNPLSQTGLNNALEILLNTDLRSEILEIKNIEVFLGEKDTIVPKNIANWYQKNNIKTNILSGGHLPFLSDEFSIK